MAKFRKSLVNGGHGFEDKIEEAWQSESAQGLDDQRLAEEAVPDAEAVIEEQGPAGENANLPAYEAERTGAGELEPATNENEELTLTLHPRDMPRSSEEEEALSCGSNAPELEDEEAQRLIEEEVCRKEDADSTAEEEPMSWEEVERLPEDDGHKSFEEENLRPHARGDDERSLEEDNRAASEDEELRRHEEEQLQDTEEEEPAYFRAQLSADSLDAAEAAHTAVKETRLTLENLSRAELEDHSDDEHCTVACESKCAEDVADELMGRLISFLDSDSVKDFGEL